MKWRHIGHSLRVKLQFTDTICKRQHAIITNGCKEKLLLSLLMMLLIVKTLRCGSLSSRRTFHQQFIDNIFDDNSNGVICIS